MDAFGFAMPLVAAGTLAAAIFTPARSDGASRRSWTVRGILDDRLIRTLSPSLGRARGDAHQPRRAERSRTTWTRALSIAPGDLSEYERHAVLHLLALESDGSNDAALCRAYVEENTRGRLLALAAMSRSTSDACRAIVLTALREGSDEERALAIDLLADAGRCDLVVGALADPLDAVAARAALSFIGTRIRTEFERILTSHVGPERLHAILSLVDGALR